MFDESPVNYKSSTHRSKTPDETLSNLEDISRKIGVTRTSNITHLDRVGIPVFTSVRPLAMDGAVSVYAGKGPSVVHAKVSSIMEAVERYSAEMQNEDTLIMKYDSKMCVDPESLILPSGVYSDGDEIEWTRGYSLIDDREVLLPSNCVYHPYNTKDVKHILYSNTNGLASGNTLGEAVFHALMEVVERDSWSLFEAFRENKPEIVCDNIKNKYINDLLTKFSDANVSIKLINLTSDNGIPTIGAVSEDLNLKDPALLTLGIGTHLDSTVAAIRAITEVAQSRVTQIHGTREDTIRANLLRDAGYERMKRLNKHWFNNSETQINLSDMPDYSQNTFKDNIKKSMQMLKKSGVDDAYYVDLTRQIGIPVARVIVPKLEVFSVDETRIGERLKPKNLVF